MAPGNKDRNGRLRAIGVVRVSQKDGRAGDSFRSPADQEAAVRAECDRQGWRLVEVKSPEINVSGSWPLTRRPGLLAAVEDVEAGRAEIVIGDAADRLTWNPGVRDEVIERVEAVGGFVWAAANGLQSNEDPARQFSGTVITAADRYSRRMNAAKARRAVVKAVEEGVLPWPNVTPGSPLGPDRRLVPAPKTRAVVAEAFRMRARGASVREVRESLARHGIRRAHSKVRALLSSRVVLG